MWRKMALFILAALVALSILPGGFSTWRDGVQISGTVHTGQWIDHNN